MTDDVTNPATGVAPDASPESRILAVLQRGDQVIADNEPVEQAAAEPTSPQPDAPVEQATDNELTADDLPDEPVAEAPSEGDAFEIVHDGQQHRLSREETIRYAQQGFDYTQKMQALADNARAVQQRLQQLEQVEQVQPVLAAELATVKAFEAQLAQYQQVDWVKLATDDPLEYPRVRAQYDQLVNGYNAAAQQYTQKRQAVGQYMDRFKAESLAKEAQMLPQVMPEWKDPAKLQAAKDEIRGYLEKMGLDPSQVAGKYLDSAFAMKTLWQSIRYEKLQSAKADKVKQLRTAPPVVRPGASQSPVTASAEREKQARDRLRKSGDLRDAAAVLLNRSK